MQRSSLGLLGVTLPALGLSLGVQREGWARPFEQVFGSTSGGTFLLELSAHAGGGYNDSVPAGNHYTLTGSHSARLVTYYGSVELSGGWGLDWDGDVPFSDVYNVKTSGPSVWSDSSSYEVTVPSGFTDWSAFISYPGTLAEDPRTVTGTI